MPNYPGIWLLRWEMEGEVEFTTIMWSDSLEAVRAVQGEEYEAAYVPERRPHVRAGSIPTSIFSSKRLCALVEDDGDRSMTPFQNR